MASDFIPQDACKVIKIDWESAFGQHYFDAGFQANGISDQSIVRTWRKGRVDLISKKQNGTGLSGVLDNRPYLFPVTLNFICG